MFRHRWVQDLHWVLVSPCQYTAAALRATSSAYRLLNPINTADSTQATKLKEWLADLDKCERVVHLAKFIGGSRQNSRLGNYFAALFEYWVRYGPDSDSFRDLHSSVQVNGPKRTIGEFDLLYRSPEEEKSSSSATVHHVELSFKYKLLCELNTAPPLQPNRERADCDSESKHTTSDSCARELSQFVGPHLSESAALKLSKLAKQCQLSQHPSALRVVTSLYGASATTDTGERSLEDNGTSDELTAFRIESAVYIRGYFLYPFRQFFDSGDAAHAASRWTTPNHERGWWCSDVEALVKLRPNSLWYRIPKLRWIAPLKPNSCNDPSCRVSFPHFQLDNLCGPLADVLTGAELLQHVEANRKVAQSDRRLRFLVAELKPSFTHSSPTSWEEVHETSRGMVVEPGWNNKAIEKVASLLKTT